MYVRNLFLWIVKVYLTQGISFIFPFKPFSFKETMDLNAYILY